MAKIFFRILICLLVIVNVKTQDQTKSNCYFRQYIEPGRSFTISNPGYPSNYPPSYSCAWTATTRSDAQIVLQCPVVNLPDVDFLLVTNTGDFRDGRHYWAPLEVRGNTVSMQLVANSWSGGTFRCQIWSELKNNTRRPDTNCDCGWSFRSRVVGGVETGINEYPYMAALLSVQRKALHCGATIIHRRVALTAAHCISKQDPTQYGLLIGDHDLSQRKETNATKLLKIIAFIPHERYIVNKGVFDIGLVISATEIIYTARVGPACLPFNRDNFIRKYVTIVGWGTKEYAGEMSDVLQKASVQVVPPENCQDIYPQKFNPYQHLCTFTKGKDACQFDSGGPLFYYDDIVGRYFVVGIVNFGRDCGEFPAANLNVHSFLDWIQEKLPSADFCVK